MSLEERTDVISGYSLEHFLSGDNPLKELTSVSSRFLSAEEWLPDLFKAITSDPETCSKLEYENA